MHGKKILITGGAGFIGHHLAHALAPGNEIFVVDNLYRHARRPAWLGGVPGLRFLHADVREESAVRSFLPSGLTHILHLAAVAGVLTVRSRAADAIRANLAGSLSIASMAQGFQGLEQLVFFSSSEVYGPNANGVVEDVVDLRVSIAEPRWSYAAGKLASEFLLYELWREQCLPVTIVRPFNVYGPHQLGESAVHSFAVAALRGSPLSVRGSGAQTRAWCHVDDMVAAVLLLLRHPRAIGEIFNVGNPAAVCTTLDLATTIVELSRSASRVEMVPLDYEDVLARVPSIRKAESLLGFVPQTSLRAGLAGTVAWYASQNQEAEPIQPVQPVR